VFYKMSAKRFGNLYGNRIAYLARHRVQRPGKHKAIREPLKPRRFSHRNGAVLLRMAESAVRIADTTRRKSRRGLSPGKTSVTVRMPIVSLTVFFLGIAFRKQQIRQIASPVSARMSDPLQIQGRQLGRTVVRVSPLIRMLCPMLDGGEIGYCVSDGHVCLGALRAVCRFREGD